MSKAQGKTNDCMIDTDEISGSISWVIEVRNRRSEFREIRDLRIRSESSSEHGL